MGTTLTGKNISASYLGLLKTTDNAVIGGTAKRLTDGNGTDSSLYLSTTSLGIGITPTRTLSVDGDADINDIVIGRGGGNFTSNTLIGNLALASNSTGEQNTAIGHRSLNANTEGEMNTAVGKDSLRLNTTGDNNTAIGRLTLQNNTIGDRNVAIGNQALGDNVSGEHNVGLGFDSLTNVSGGDGNIGIGYEAGSVLVTGNNNIIIGKDAEVNATSSTNEIVIGYNTTGNGSNTVTIGNSSITANHLTGELKLGSYGSGTYTGTATQRLGVTSSGQVIEIPIGGGAVDGSGTANTVTMWTDSDTIGNAPITISGNNSTFAGTITASGGSTNNNDDANILTLNASEHARLLVDTSSTSGHRATLALESNGNELTLSTTGSVSELTSVGNLTVSSSATTFAGSIIAKEGLQASKFETDGNDLVLSANTTQTNVSPNIIFKSSVTGGSISERMRLDSSGRLGINLTPTTSPLEIKSNSISSSGSGISIIQNGVGTDAIIRMGERDTNGARFHMYDGGVEKIAFYTDGTANHISAGNLGIGTDSPAKPLHILSADNQPLRVESTDAYSGIELKDNGSSTLPPLISALSDDFIFYGGHSTSRPAIMFLDSSSANVGIGTTSPDFTLDISNTTFGNQLRLHRSSVASGGFLTLSANDSAGNKQDYAKIGAIVESSTSGSEDGSLVFQTSLNSVLTERMRLDSSGQLGLGTTSPQRLLNLSQANGANIRFDNSTTGRHFVIGEGVGTNDVFSFRGISYQSTDTLSIDFANDRVGIGTIAPDANLEIRGTLNTDDCKIYLKENDNFGAFIKYDGATNEGYIGGITSGTTENDVIAWSRDASNLMFLTSGSERARLDSSGNLLLGTTSQAGNGQLSIGIDDSNGGRIALTNLRTALFDGDSLGRIEFVSNDTTSTGVKAMIIAKTEDVSANTNIQFHTGGTLTERMRITSAGLVGIGTNSPSEKLEVVGDIKASSSENTQVILTSGGACVMDLLNAQSEAYLRTTTEHDLHFRTNNLNRMMIDGTTGNVGIGTSSPSVQLEVKGSTFSLIRVNGANDAVAGIDFGDTDDNDIGRIRYDNSVDAMLFFTNNTEQARLDSSGQLAIGTTTATAPLTVAGTTDLAWSASTSKLQISRSGSLARLQNYESGSAGNIALAWDGGNVGIGTGSPNGKLTISDANATGLEINPLDSQNRVNIMAYDRTDSAYRELNFDGSNYNFEISNSTKVVIDTSGNVGIGTTSPQGKVHISDTSTQLVLETPNETNDIDFRFRENGSNKWNLRYQNSSNALEFLNQTGTSLTQLSLKADGTSIFGGNVGIGTDSPVSKLETKDGDIRVTTLNSFSKFKSGRASIPSASGFNLGGLHFEAYSTGTTYVTGSAIESYADGSAWTSTSTPSYLSFQTVPSGSTSLTERMRITSAGNVGINCTPSYKLQWSDGTRTGLLDTNIGAVVVGSTTNDALALYTNLTEKMRITSGGDVLIGNSSVPANGSGGSAFVDSSVDRKYLILSSSSDSAVGLVYFDNTNGTVGNISTSGTSTAYNTSSDYRLKEDLQDFNALDIASKIKMYDFKWKADDSRSYGVMAHELKEVVPQAVSGEKDAEEMQQVDYSKLVPILLKSIQELKAEIDELKKNK